MGLGGGMLLWLILVSPLIHPASPLLLGCTATDPVSMEYNKLSTDVAKLSTFHILSFGGGRGGH